MRERNFLYKKKSYSFDLDLFTTHSSYFSLNGEKLNDHDFFLLTEYDYRSNLSDESITTFIKFCQNQEIIITNSNVLSINFLSKKYNVKLLIEKTDNYIKNHYKEIIDIFLSSEQNEINQIEDIISNYLFDFLSDDRLLFFNLSSIHRIISKFNSKKKDYDISGIDFKIIDFIFKYIVKNGINSSILFSLIEINDQNAEYLTCMLSKHSDSFDFRFVDPKIFHFLNSIFNQQKIKEAKFLNKIEEMKIEHEQKEKELKELIEQQQILFQKQISFIFDNLGQLNFPNDKTIIKEGEFRNFALKEIVIPSTVKIIESNAFYGCSFLKKVIIPSSVTSIGSFSFANCTSLQQVNIPSSVTKIEKCTFYNCSSITQIIIHPSITSIEKDSFLGCSSLKKLTISINENNFFTIGDVNFNDSKSIKKMILKYYLFKELLKEKLFCEESSIIKNNDIYYKIIHLISLIISNPNKKMIFELFKQIKENTELIDFVDKIFPYFLFKESNLSKILYWIPLSKEIIKNEIHLTITIDNNRIEFNESSTLDFSIELIMNEKDSLSLSEDSKINYTNNKNSMKVKDHTNDENDKYDFIFYNIILELTKNPNQSVNIKIIKQILSETRNKFLNNDTNIKSFNSIPSLKSLFNQNQISIISIIWNIIYTIPENVVFDILKIFHPIESRLLLSSFNAFKNINKKLFVHIIQWSKWAFEIESGIDFLFKLINISNVTQLSNDFDFDELVNRINDEMLFLQKIPEQMKEYCNFDDLIKKCQKYLAQIIENRKK